MIEIKNNNGVYEAWLNGGLFESNEDLEFLLYYLSGRVKELEEGMK